MARINVSPTPIRTAEGAPAKRISAEQQLERSVMSCLLWEKEFYEDGLSIAERIAEHTIKVTPEFASALAIRARKDGNLRHVPLLIVAAMAKHHGGKIVADTIYEVVDRADELAELVAVIAQINNVAPDDIKPVLSAQVKRGLARAFTKFSEYQLAKYNRPNAIKLRDVLFLCHAKPKNTQQAAVWKRLVDGTLATPDTWEVALSTGEDKRESFERLLMEGKLGYLALLRNLRNMLESGVNEQLIRDALLARRGAQRVLPFRYIAAARHATQLEPVLDQALQASLAEMPTLPGRTLVLVDVSGSMGQPLSSRSDLTRLDAAAALGAIVPAEQLRVFSFSTSVVEVPPRKGMAGVDAIIRSQPRSMTELGGAVRAMNALTHDRLIVITDEQSHSRVPDPVARHAYMINVASNRNGVGYGKWTHIDGFSESVLKFITAYEQE